MSASNIDTLPPEIIGLVLNHLEPVIPIEVDELTIIDTKPQFKAFSLTNKACRASAQTSLKTFKPKTTAIITGFSSYINQIKRSLPASDQQAVRDYFLSHPLSKCDTIVFPASFEYSSRRNLNDLSHFTFRAPAWVPFPRLRTLSIDDRVHRSSDRDKGRDEIDKKTFVGLFNDLATFTLKYGSSRDLELAVETYTDRVFTSSDRNGQTERELELNIAPSRMVWNGTSLDVPAWRESSTGRNKVDHTFNIDVTDFLSGRSEEHGNSKALEDAGEASGREEWKQTEIADDQVISSFKRLFEGQVRLMNRSGDTTPSRTRIDLSASSSNDSAVRDLCDLRAALIEVVNESRLSLEGEHQLILTIQGEESGTSPG